MSASDLNNRFIGTVSQSESADEAQTLRKLEAEFDIDLNPVFALRALRLVLHRADLSQYVHFFLRKALDEIESIAARAAAGERVEREAEAVGRALRFGRGQFRKAAGLRRNLNICRRIHAALAENPEVKLDQLYNELAGDFGVHRSTIGRAWRALARFTR